MMEINCWRYYARQDGHNGDGCLNGSRGSHCMAGHRLAGTDWYAVGVLAEASFDSLCLCPIIVRSRSAMSIDVVDLVGTQPCFLQGAPGSLRIIIAAREGVHIIEGGHSNGCNPFFRPTSNHCTGIATANRFPGLSDGVAACSAGGNSGPVRSLRSCHDGDDAGGPVD